LIAHMSSGAMRKCTCSAIKTIPNSSAKPARNSSVFG
jgi:hypothetical protein